MPNQFIATNQEIIHFALEATYKAGATHVGADAVLCSNLSVTPLEIVSKERDTVQPWYGAPGVINVKFKAKLSFTVELSGSGTPGTPPKIGKLLKTGGYTETILAAAVTGTAQVGGSGSPGSIKLAAGASAIDDFYNGFDLIITAGTAAAPSTRHMIIDYNGTTKMATLANTLPSAPDATSAYSIQPGVDYSPNSDIQLTNLNSGCIRYNRGGVEHIMLGAKCNVKEDLKGEDYGKMMFEFEGLVGTITDAPALTADFNGWLAPLALTAANLDNAYIFGMSEPIIESVMIDNGNVLTNPPSMNAEFVAITGRKAKLDLKLMAVKNSVMNWWAAAQVPTMGKIGLSVGKHANAGNIVSFLATRAQAVNVNYGDESGISTHELSFTLRPDTGNDELHYIFK